MTELERLRDENEVLRARIAELTRPSPRPLPLAWQLTTKEDAVVAALAAAPPGEVVSLERLVYVVNEDPFSERASSENTLKTILHRARHKVAAFGIEIETVWGRGVRLTPTGRARILEEVAANG